MGAISNKLIFAPTAFKSVCTKLYVFVPTQIPASSYRAIGKLVAHPATSRNALFRSRSAATAGSVTQLTASSRTNISEAEHIRVIREIILDSSHIERHDELKSAILGLATIENPTSGTADYLGELYKTHYSLEVVQNTTLTALEALAGRGVFLSIVRVESLLSLMKTYPHMSDGYAADILLRLPRICINNFQLVLDSLMKLSAAELYYMGTNNFILFVKSIHQIGRLDARMATTLYAKANEICELLNTHLYSLHQELRLRRELIGVFFEYGIDVDQLVKEMVEKYYDKIIAGNEKIKPYEWGVSVQEFYASYVLKKVQPKAARAYVECMLDWETRFLNKFYESCIEYPKEMASVGREFNEYVQSALEKHVEAIFDYKKFIHIPNLIAKAKLTMLLTKERFLANHGAAFERHYDAAESDNFRQDIIDFLYEHEITYELEEVSAGFFARKKKTRPKLRLLPPEGAIGLSDPSDAGGEIAVSNQ